MPNSISGPVPAYSDNYPSAYGVGNKLPEVPGPVQPVEVRYSDELAVNAQWSNSGINFTDITSWIVAS